MRVLFVVNYLTPRSSKPRGPCLDMLKTLSWPRLFGTAIKNHRGRLHPPQKESK